MTQFNCSACGGPNEPEAGMTRMTCTYCGANLTIPESLRIKATPKVEKNPSKVKPVVSAEIDAPDLIRKAEPIAVKAWNLYTAWTWIRWALPACLTLIVFGIILCVALGALPLMFKLFR
ncbi:MAG: hypothetical protein U0V02_05805 [Anaerolineales bacterium]